MGNEQAVASAVGSESGYKRYWVEMERQPLTDVPPFRNPEIAYLRSVFEELDAKRQKSIEVANFDNYYALREHPLYERIRELFREELEKMKTKRVTFEVMLFLLSVFHIETEVDHKYRYLFRLYDTDRDLKVGVNDLVAIFEILYYGPVYDEQVYRMMAEQTVSKYGTGGFLRLEQFVAMVHEDQVKEVMTLKFIEI